LWYAAGGLALYCIALTVLTGDIGFDGDDWWVLACPFWNSFPYSILEYAREFLRPIEGVYWIGLFEIFGFNKPVFHFCSLLLLAGASVLMGFALSRAFPGRRLFVVLAVFLAFFLPTVSCLTYVLFTDNSRLALMLFWASVLAFQSWATKFKDWTGLWLPVVLYVASFLTYESSGFLLFLVPLLVWPVFSLRADRFSDTGFPLRLGVGMSSAFSLALAIRFLFLSGGAVAQRHFLPPTELLWSYPALLPFYLVAPFTWISSDGWAWLLAMLMAAAISALILAVAGTGNDGNAADVFRRKKSYLGCILLVGLGIAFLGMLPYQLAGYGSSTPKLAETLMAKCGLVPDGNLAWFDFNWASRIFSSASCGVAILIAALATAPRRKTARIASISVAVVALAFMVLFHAGLSKDWKGAAATRNDLIRSLVAHVPDVRSESNFVFLDLECYHGRAPVIRRWSGLRELVRMLYRDRTLGAWYLYPCCWEWPNKVFQKAFVCPRGFVSRGMKMDQPAPHDSLVILKRSGNELVMLNKIEPRDGSVSTGIAWLDAKELKSNRDRILAWSDAPPSEARLASNAWDSGLIATLNLYRVRFSLSYLRGRTYVVVHDAVGRRISKDRLNRVHTSQ